MIETEAGANQRCMLSFELRSGTQIESDGVDGIDQSLLYSRLGVAIESGCKFTHEVGVAETS